MMLGIGRFNGHDVSEQQRSVGQRHLLPGYAAPNGHDAAKCQHAILVRVATKKALEGTREPHQ